jgi:rhamnogalacturonyl hydrolase YesR
MFPRALLFLIISLLRVAAAPPSTSAPLAVLHLIATSMFRYGLNNSDFFNYNYGPGYAFAALYEAAHISPDLNFTTQLDTWLDFYLQPNGYAYNVTHSIPMPYTGAVGEPTSFAVAYAARARSAEDIAVATMTADKFMMAYPYRLSDGTFVRPNGWGNEQGSSFLWGDDQFMALALLCRLSRAGAPNAAAYLSVSITNALTNAIRAQNSNGLFPHGFNTLTNESSCCVWGRANGWIAMSLVEVLQALSPNAPSRPAVLSVFTRLAEGIANTQDVTDGRWHQVLNETSTFLETSATAMFTYALATGVREGWLPRTRFAAIANAGWVGINQAVRADGQVDGICEGTPVLLTAAQYNERTTLYNQSTSGLGGVMLAAMAISRM